MDVVLITSMKNGTIKQALKQGKEMWKMAKMEIKTEGKTLRMCLRKIKKVVKEMEQALKGE